MTAKETIVIAIDGYSSCGKSTTARALARKLNYVYVDSGAMYRAVTLYFLRKKVDLTRSAAIVAALDDIHIDLLPGADGQETRVVLNGEDVSDEIRQMYISDAVSEVSAIREVRKALVKLQQKMGNHRNIVMDGRDIGTAVFPHAQVKIFMTADPKVRAGRRYKELTDKGQQITFEEVFENIAYRDFMDTTRKESPLSRAEDAIILDNSSLSEAEQLQFILDIVQTIPKTT